MVGHHSIVAQLESFRQNLESKVAIKENENRTILQQMQHAEQDLEVPILVGRNVIHFSFSSSIGSAANNHSLNICLYIDDQTKA